MFEEDHAPVTLSEISESAVARQYIELADYPESIFDRLFPLDRYTNISIHSLFNYSFSFGVLFGRRTIVGLRRAGACHLDSMCFVPFSARCC